MTKLERVPHGIKAIQEYYGNPDANNDYMLDPEFVKNNLIIVTLPFPMVASWNKNIIISRVQIHKLVAPSLLDALTEILEYKGLKYLQKNKFDRTGGTYCWRPMTSGRALSTHAFGIAIDINPDLGPYNVKEHKQPQFIIDAFEKRGWLNLVHDRMHFQACTGY